MYHRAISKDKGFCLHFINIEEVFLGQHGPDGVGIAASTRFTDVRTAQQLSVLGSFPPLIIVALRPLSPSGSRRDANVSNQNL
jgi:hypothetical protein